MDLHTSGTGRVGEAAGGCSESQAPRRLAGGHGQQHGDTYGLGA